MCNDTLHREELRNRMIQDVGGIFFTRATAWQSAILADLETWVAGTASVFRTSATLSTISQTAQTWCKAECQVTGLESLTSCTKGWHHDMDRMAKRLK